MTVIKNDLIAASIALLNGHRLHSRINRQISNHFLITGIRHLTSGTERPACFEIVPTVHAVNGTGKTPLNTIRTGSNPYGYEPLE
jgi:hypothetical protein